MYSVDISEKWYRSDKRETGFIAKKYIEEMNGNIRHEFMLGKSIPNVIEMIKGDIDFCVLDTTHSMPGEFLDFLICLPYFENGCIVVLHDVIENHMTCRNHEVATKLLFDLVQGEKWYMHENQTDVFGFSNIAAFVVSEETRKNIHTLFSGLTMSWEYMPSDKELKRYYELAEKHYSNEYLDWLKRIVMLQKYTFIRKEVSAHYGLEHGWLKRKWRKAKRVFLYGGGYWAKVYTEYSRINDLPLNGWIISDEQDLVETGQYNLPVYRLSDLPYSPDECSIILALDKRHFGMVKKNLDCKGYYNVL